MKVFVAAGPGTKKRSDDFNWTVDGELVRLPFGRCDCPDCGCERAMAGLASSKATTTFAVVDNPELDAETYDRAFIEAVVRQGFLAEGDDAGWIAEIADEHLRLASQFNPGQLLEIRRGRVHAR